MPYLLWTLCFRCILFIAHRLPTFRYSRIYLISTSPFLNSVLLSGSILISQAADLRTSSESKERGYSVLHSVHSCLGDSPCFKLLIQVSNRGREVDQVGTWGRRKRSRVKTLLLEMLWLRSSFLPFFTNLGYEFLRGGIASCHYLNLNLLPLGRCFFPSSCGSTCEIKFMYTQSNPIFLTH